MLGMSRLKMKMNLMFDMGNRKDINLYIMASYVCEYSGDKYYY